MARRAHRRRSCDCTVFFIVDCLATAPPQLGQQDGHTTTAGLRLHIGGRRAAGLAIHNGREDDDRHGEQQGGDSAALRCRGGSFEIVDVLIQSGVFVNPLDLQQKTPLDCAIAGGHTAIITRLVGVGGETGAVRSADTKNV